MVDTVAGSSRSRVELIFEGRAERQRAWALERVMERQCYRLILADGCTDALPLIRGVTELNHLESSFHAGEITGEVGAGARCRFGRGRKELRSLSGAS